MRISDWSSDVCSSDLAGPAGGADNGDQRQREDDLEQHGHEGSVSAIAIECQYGQAHLSDARVAALAARRPRRGKELALAIDARRKLGPAPERVVEGTLLGVAEQEGDLRQRDVRIAQQVFGGGRPPRREPALGGT